MSRKLEFRIGDVIILVEEGDFDGDGNTDLKFTVNVDESGGQTADLRGLFWDVADEGKLSGMSVWDDGSPDITDSEFDANAVHDLGNGANMNGAVKKKARFDAGVEIGSQGIGKDDIQSTSFVITGAEDLTLDDIGGMRFGVRLTSVGEIDGAREDSLKLLGVAPHAPDAIDDCLETDEDTAKSINILANDSDDDGDPLTVIAIAGGTIGTEFAVTTDGGREGYVTVEADGTFSFDPKANFQNMTTGDTDGFTLIYTISDGDGGEDCAEVKVLVNGINDAPVANDDGYVYVESKDTVLVNVLGNDTDVDGTLNAASLAFAGVDNGVATNDGGQLKYVAGDIGGDNIDDSVRDDLTYTVEDNEGLVSNAAGVQVRVIDPLVETATQSLAAANGQLLSLSLSTEDRTYNDSSFVDVDITAGGLSQAVNVSFVIDGSGSISGSEYDEQVLAVQNTINQLRADYAGSPAVVTVQLVKFASNAATSPYWALNNPALDNVASGTVLSGGPGGATNYDAGLLLAEQFFSGKGAQDNFLLFTSDGAPTAGGDYLDSVAALNADNVSITAVGFGGANLGVLNQIDNTGGAQIVANAAGLGDVFADSPLFPAKLVDFSLSVDGNEVFDFDDLNDLGGGDYDLNSVLTALSAAGMIGDSNTVKAEAWFDTNNDYDPDAPDPSKIDEYRFVETVIEGTNGTDILFA